MGRDVVDAYFLTSILTMSVMTSLCAVQRAAPCVLCKLGAAKYSIWSLTRTSRGLLTHLNCTLRDTCYLRFCLLFEIRVSLSSVSLMLCDIRIRKGKFAQSGSNECKMETDEGRGGQETKLYG